MKIIIKDLTMTNFKCFRNKHLEFNDNITSVSGRNGVGKTTIADAILFCLFGKNTAGQSDLEIFKTRYQGKVIPNIDHAVELTLNVIEDAHEKTITLRRSIKEVWVKRRGSEEMVFKNNTCEYFVNGESYTQADYKKYIDSLISEDTFRSITSPTYFLSLKWQQQRDFLTNMVGNIDVEEIADSDELRDLVAHLDEAENGRPDIIAYRKHLSYQIKQIKDKLDKIPVRLEEQNKALPERLDWDAIQKQLDEASLRRKEIEEKYLAIRSGHGDDVRRKEINAELDNMLRAKRERETTVRVHLRELQTEHDKKFMEASRQFSKLVTTQRDLEDAIHSLETMCDMASKTADDNFAKERDEIRNQWPQTQLKFSEDDGRCKVCGQILPPDQLEEARNKFNIWKANLKKTLVERSNKAKDELAKAKATIEDYQKQKEDKEKLLAETKEAINKAFAEKADIEKEHIPTEEEELSNDADYQTRLEEIADMQKKLAECDVDSDNDKQALEDLVQQKAECSEALANYQKQLATHDLYNYIQSLIEGINNEQKDLVTQLSELERQEDVARNYQFRENSILEERLNNLFSIVQWRLFRTVNNGGDSFEEPYCECLVGGIPYGGGLNQGARLNAGLDICNTLCRHFNVSAPIIIDNAESTINILETIGQQIRLQVVDKDLEII